MLLKSVRSETELLRDRLSKYIYTAQGQFFRVKFTVYFEEGSGGRGGRF